MNTFLLKILEKKLKKYSVDEPMMSGGILANTPLITIIREVQNTESEDKNFQEMMFSNLIYKLEIAEGIGISKKERLQKEIDEWAGILDDDLKGACYNFGKQTMLLSISPKADLGIFFSELASKVNKNFVKAEEIADDLDVEDIKKMKKEWRIFPVKFIFNIMLYKLSLKRLSPEMKQIMKKELEELTIVEFFKIITTFTNYSEDSFRVMKKLLKEILLAHNQVEYYNRIVKYKDELYPQSDYKLAETEEQSDRKMEIGLPKIKERKGNDGITALSLTQTAIFFNMLRQEKVIFKDESYQSKENIYKAIQVLTGYSKQTLKEAMNKVHNEQNDEEVTRKMFEKLSRY